jgi:hypothetical protein
MVDEIRKPFNVKFTKSELERVKKVAADSHESASGYIRRQILMIVEEEESQRE